MFQDNDRTDPLVPSGAPLERATLLLTRPAGRLERVELWNDSGRASSFLRLSIPAPGPLAEALHTLLPALPEAATLFRDLLLAPDCALCAAFDEPAVSLSALLDGAADPPLRSRDVLELLANLSAVLAAMAQHGLVLAAPDPEWIAFAAPPPDGIPATRFERRAVLLDWAGLAPGDEAQSAAALLKLGREALSVLMERSAHSGMDCALAGLCCFDRRLAALSGEAGLSYARIGAALALYEPRLRLYGASDKGLRRSGNEDSFLLLDQQQQGLSGAHLVLGVVADGMGGHASGEVASSLALDLLRGQLNMHLLRPRTTVPEPAELAGRIAAAMPLISETLTARAGLDELLAGMGTTLCGLGLIRAAAGGGWHSALFNVGDSRAYLVHAGGLCRLSLDHSHVQELVSAGEITPEEAFSHPRKNIITRCLGGGGGMAAADVTPFLPGPGEWVLLCSDGLSDALRDREIEQVLRETLAQPLDEAAPRRAAEALIEAANRAGGPDNITVVIIECG